jgi:hypothetical protein
MARLGHQTLNYSDVGNVEKTGWVTGKET